MADRNAFRLDAIKTLDLDQEGAAALLASTFGFLRRKKISRESIMRFARSYPNLRRGRKNAGIYRELERCQEDMGLILGTWFTNPRFLDAAGRPLPLFATGRGESVAALIRASGAQISLGVARELMKRSRSVRVDKEGRLIALRRAFVLPNLEVLRAAFVVERYLSMLQEIALRRKREAPLLLERSCHVSKVDLGKIMPLLRDIESRGTSFMDSIDGDLEERRLHNSKRKDIGEIGVHVFVWIKPRR